MPVDLSGIVLIHIICQVRVFSFGGGGGGGKFKNVLLDKLLLETSPYMFLIDFVEKTNPHAARQ